MSLKASSLRDLLRSLEREKESLKHVLLSGKISHGTFDLLEKRIDKTTSLVSELEEALEEEEAFWRKNLLRGITIFETLLVELEHKRLLGEVRKEKYRHDSEVIRDCLSSMRRRMRENDESKEETASALKQSKEDSPHNGNGEKREPCSRRTENSIRKNRDVQEISDERLGTSEIHCMNPWNPECRNTDIEVSIYYEGRMVPICRRCWEEIANKDVEWSSL